MNDDLARTILRAVLARAEGAVGNFVDLRELATLAPFADPGVNAILDELLARRWMYRRGHDVCVSRPAVEFAIEWDLADRVLVAIAKVAGQGGLCVSYNRVIAEAGLPADKTDELMEELSLLGLANRSGRARDGACITGLGMSRLNANLRNAQDARPGGAGE